MKLPRIDNTQEYVGLYVIDFSLCEDMAVEQCAVGYTAEEVAVLLESQRFADAKVYKIHRAAPDGTMELAGVSADRFRLESGMFFHCRDEGSGKKDYQMLLAWAGEQAPPCRAKLHRARRSDGQILVGLIYPAEYEQEIGRWLGESGFRGAGPVDAGISQVADYYQGQFTVLQRQQLWPAESLQARDRETLLAAVAQPLQR